MITMNSIKLLLFKEQLKLTLIIKKFKKIFLKKNNILKQHSQLTKYYNEYYIESFDNLKSGISVVNWNFYIKFLNMLSRNIELQSEKLLTYDENLKQIQIDYKNVQKKINIYKKLESKILQNYFLKKETIQQKYDDNFFSLFFLKKE